MSRNAEVAAVLDEYADLLEAMGDDYRPSVYRRAADNVRDHPEAIEDLVDEGADAVERIDGVGEGIADHVVDYVETGSFAELEDARDELPVEMDALTRVEGVGPKTVKKLYDALGVTTLDDLEDAAESGEISGVSGFGAKTEANIREGIPFARQAGERALLGETRPLADDVVDHLETHDAVERAAIAGSIRRWRETNGDVDVLAASDAGQRVGDHLADWERVGDVIETGETKTSVRVDGLRVDLRVVVDAEFGAALQYFTGSKAHNVTLRNHAIAQGKKVNEYGAFDIADVDDPDAGQRVGDLLAAETEAGVYDALGLPWIPPELREDRGEIDAAREGALPDLVAEDDLRGDLHVHTDWSDGGHSLREMIEAAAEFGHDYVCITDHAEGPGVFGDSGLSDADLREQMDAVDDVRDDVAVEVLHGVEANVDADGDVGSVSDDVLADLDLVIASPHSGLGDDGGDRTARLVAAVEHPRVDVLGHPSGRLLTERPAMAFDAAALAAAAADAGTALEVNANYHRLDLWGTAVRAAVDAGATIAVDTDAHSPAEYAQRPYGVHTARRGWAEAGDVLNARDADGLRAFLD
ncbi:helix-hairpin-helix domain-containing protein [Halarchaeum nitratireducens]|uniref:DNA polymerase beta n=1 Tax=Halarchaeum nitratireducens TaxID=489913 RepID=A0A830GB29_9EURY|nr:helix-hairpin-helix domain-containing protein [Halarchaeum nitratireducens]MBP2251495.1 DNA polymerase (family 10) [Halarchaeum solikamskense]GGN14474.1 DNA polymerase/3'-5' exonuclease PolX [Halarchaeum nitratireducens]